MKTNDTPIENFLEPKKAQDQTEMAFHLILSFSSYLSNFFVVNFEKCFCLVLDNERNRKTTTNPSLNSFRHFLKESETNKMQWTMHAMAIFFTTHVQNFSILWLYFVLLLLSWCVPRVVCHIILAWQNLKSYLFDGIAPKTKGRRRRSKLFFFFKPRHKTNSFVFFFFFLRDDNNNSLSQVTFFPLIINHANEGTKEKDTQRGPMGERATEVQMFYSHVV